MAQNPHNEPLLLKLVTYLMAVTGLVGILFVFYAVITPVFYSEERREEIVAEREAAEAERIADWEDQLRDRAVEVVGGLYYVQDSRTGICFAVRSVYRLGHLAQVDCEAVPANMLLVTE